MSTPALDRLVADGLSILRSSSTVDVPPSMRLKIYDALSGCKAISQSVSGRIWKIDGSVGNYTRYRRLALATARHALPIWDAFFQTRDADYDN
jgi:hypothetical protein